MIPSIVRAPRTLGFATAASLMLLAVGCSGGSSTASGTQQQAVQVSVSGSSQVRLGATDQYTATVSNSSNSAVTWQVNSVTGGNATTGTISTTGLYTPPAALPSGNSVTVTAISVASPTVSGSAQLSIFNPIPSVSSATATLASGTTFSLDVEGANFVVGAQIQAAGVNVPTTLISSTDVQATVTIPSGTTTLAVVVTNPDPGSAASSSANAQIVQTTITAAARLLDQATFGPTLTDIGTVQTLGLNGYISQQFATTTTLLPNIPVSPLPALCVANNTPTPCEESEWWQTALTGPDQLRQRVAFALSEIFVISTDTDNAQTVTYYHNMLAQDAFTNFSTIMHDVSLSPGMGAYLNMLNSAKPPTGQIANENYPRELMQLFTLGLIQLNQDGTPLLTGGVTTPTYTETQVEAFARAYTGWTYATASGGSPTSYPNNTANYFAPMAPVETQHDMTAKILLGTTTLPAGQTAEVDLAGALANIFAQPNVAPFVCKQLIQHLVTSTPSPAYVSRISAVFANNGSGVRGDMQAVVRAILMDTEARAGDTNATYDGGHLREPILWITNALRGLGFTNTDVNGSYYSLSGQSSQLNEEPYRSGSVFNFFPPSYVIPETTLNAPEFDIENTATANLRETLANTIVFNKLTSFNINLAATSTLGTLAANPANLVDSLGVIFMHAQMPTLMRTQIINAITPLTDNGQRARVAVFLVITAPQYKVMH